MGHKNLWADLGCFFCFCFFEGGLGSLVCIFVLILHQSLQLDLLRSKKKTLSWIFPSLCFASIIYLLQKSLPFLVAISSSLFVVGETNYHLFYFLLLPVIWESLYPFFGQISLSLSAQVHSLQSIEMISINKQPLANFIVENYKLLKCLK